MPRGRPSRPPKVLAGEAVVPPHAESGSGCAGQGVAHDGGAEHPGGPLVSGLHAAVRLRPVSNPRGPAATCSVRSVEDLRTRRPRSGCRGRGGSCRTGRSSRRDQLRSSRDTTAARRPARRLLAVAVAARRRPSAVPARRRLRARIVRRPAVTFGTRLGSRRRRRGRPATPRTAPRRNAPSMRLRPVPAIVHASVASKTQRAGHVAVQTQRLSPAQNA